ncbi:MAG: hypothetical protein ACPG6L_03335 [Nereida ignava]
MLNDFDKGPTKRIARVFAAIPDVSAHSDLFWHDWGPIFYRGLLNSRARVLVVASDPGPTERLIGRSLIGDAGQRVQGFLAKLGLNESYVCLNAHAYSLHPSKFSEGKRLLADPDLTRWRNRVFGRTTGPALQAIVAFGSQAQRAVELWHNKPDVPVHDIPHPSSRDPEKLARMWGAAITALRPVVTPDDSAGHQIANYGTTLAQADYADIPRGDLPFGTPWWIGRDPPRNGRPDLRQSSVERSGQDEIHWTVRSGQRV